MLNQFYLLSFIIGVIFAYQWTSPWDLAKVVWLIFFPCRRLLWALLFGALTVFLAASYHQNKQLSPELWQAPQEIHLEVQSHRAIERYLQHYQVSSPELNQSFGLSHYSSEQRLSVGHCYQTTVKLKPRHALGNPNTADQAKQFWVKREFVQGHIQSKSQISEIPCKTQGLSLQPLRLRIHEHLASLPLSQTARAILNALLIGDRSALEQMHWTVFKNTGTGHLMAISGLHIGLVFLCANVLGALILRPLGLIFLRSNPLVISRVFALICSGLYVWVSGAGVSSLRAWGMLAVITGLSIKREHLQGIQVLLMVVSIILIQDPLAGMGMGLWLSVGAVFALIWLRAKAWEVHWKLALILLPMSAFWLSASNLSPFVNLIAIPYVSFLVVPGALLSVIMFLLNIPGADQLMIAVAWSIDLMWSALAWIAPYASLLHWSLLTTTDVILFFTLIVCLLLPWRFVGWIPYAVLMAALTWPKPILPEPGVVHLDVIDAGQGTALWVQVGRKNLIFDVGSPLVAEYLQHYRVRKLDVAVISHQDKDHRAGFAELLEQIPIETIYVGETLTETKNTQPCLYGQTWYWDEVKFEFISPRQQGSRGNNASCVLKISIGEQSILLTGDIESKVERDLLANLDPELLKSTLLIAPHHGSKTSSTVDFIKAVSPTVVIYPTGFLNAYHHPHPLIVERYQALNVKQYNTAQDGALRVRLSKYGIESLQCYKQEHPHWWDMDEEARCSGYLAQVGH